MAAPSECHASQDEGDKKVPPKILPCEDVNDWNPMEDAFNDPNFNQYTHGAAKYTPDSKEQASNPRRLRPGMENYSEVYRVFISKPPVDMDEDGIFLLASKVSARPINVYRKRDFTDGKPTWAIVEFAKHSDARKMIQSLHKVPPLNLDVQFGFSDEEKARHARERDERRRCEEEAAGHRIREPVNEMLATLPDAQPVGMEKFPGEEHRGKVLKVGGRGLPLNPPCRVTSWPQEPRAGGLSQHAAATVNLNELLDPLHQSSELDYFGQYAGGYNDDATAVISKAVDKLQRDYNPVNSRSRNFGGRGYYMPNRASERKPGGLRHSSGRAYNPVQHTGLSNPRNEAPWERTKKLEFVGPNGGTGQCGECHRNTSLRCVRCNAWFCSEACLDVAGMHPFKCEVCDLVDSNWKAIFVSRGAGSENRSAPQQQQQANGHQDQHPGPEYIEPNYGAGRGLPKQPEGVPPSCLSLLLNPDDLCASCIVQSKVLRHGEPVFFVCALINGETNKIYDMLQEPLRKACAKLPPIKESQMEPGLLVAVNLGLQGWCRGVLDQMSYGLWHVTCFDVGRYEDAIPTSIRILPEEFKHLPRLSLAASLVDTFIPAQKIWDENLLISSRLWVSHITELPVSEGGGEKQLVCDLRTIDGANTLGVLVLTEWMPLSPPPASPPCPPMLRLTPSCEVIVSTFCSPHMVYVRPTDDKEVTEQFQVLLQDLAMHCLSVPSLKRIPMVGTLVGARSGVDGNFYRGLVSLPLSDTLAVITMVDYGNREELHCSQLFPLSQKLAEVQCLAALVRVSGVKDEPINIDSYQYLSRLVGKETQLQLTFHEPGDPVTLVETGTAISVNRKLRDSMQGSWLSNIKCDEQMEELIHNYSIGKPTLGMLMSTILPLGRLSQFVVLQCLGQHEFVCCLSQDPLLRYVVKILTERMTQYVEECKHNRYVPSNEELCIAQWDDGLWYRAIAMCSSFVTTQVTFLDFGDVKELPHTQIRRMPHDFNEVPALATYATLAGVEKSDFPNEKLSNRIMQLLVTKSTFDGVVLEQDEEDLTAEIFIPKIFKTLLEENLIPDTRVEEVDEKLRRFKNTKTEFTGTPEAHKSKTSIPQYMSNIRRERSSAARAEVIEKVKTLSLEETSLVPLPERTDKSKILNLIRLEDGQDDCEMNHYATPTSIKSRTLLDASIDSSDNVSELSPQMADQRLINVTPEPPNHYDAEELIRTLITPKSSHHSDVCSLRDLELGDGNSQESGKGEGEMEISDGEDSDDVTKELQIIKQKYMEQMAKAEEEFKQQMKALAERKKKKGI